MSRIVVWQLSEAAQTWAEAATAGSDVVRSLASVKLAVRGTLTKVKVGRVGLLSLSDSKRCNEGRMCRVVTMVEMVLLLVVLSEIIQLYSNNVLPYLFCNVVRPPFWKGVRGRGHCNTQIIFGV